LSAEPRIVFLDIETAPITGLAWTMFEANLIHVTDPTFLLCYGIKWADGKNVRVRALCDLPNYKKNKKTDKGLVRELWDVLDRADIVIAHNGDAFDIKKINARFAVHGLKPPSPYKTVDTLKVARRYFKFDSNKLDNIGRYLEVGRKLPNTGKDLWIGCMAGNQVAWRMMKQYNKQDVLLLERVYHKIKAWSDSHPVLTAYHPMQEMACPTCLSTHVQRNGWKIARFKKSPRFHCQSCGHWFLGPNYNRGIQKDIA
jgi:uncharacterized protein YprB with RNaseH-like and TPR domain